MSGYLKNFWDDFDRNQALVLLVVKPLGKQMLIQPQLVQELTILRPEASHFGIRHLLTISYRGVAVGVCVCDANKVLFAARRDLHGQRWLLQRCLG